MPNVTGFQGETNILVFGGLLTKLSCRREGDSGTRCFACSCLHLLAIIQTCMLDFRSHLSELSIWGGPATSPEHTYSTLIVFDRGVVWIFSVVSMLQWSSELAKRAPVEHCLPGTLLVSGDYRGKPVVCKGLTCSAGIRQQALLSMSHAWQLTEMRFQGWN